MIQLAAPLWLARWSKGAWFLLGRTEPPGDRWRRPDVTVP